MNIVIGCDLMGLKLKDAIKKMLIESGHTVNDVGSYSEEKQITHPEAGAAVAVEIQKGNADRGILVCGTGMGVAIAANKFKGVYAAVVESEFTARHCRSINGCNVLCLGGGFVLGELLGLEITKEFLSTDFGQGFDKNMKGYLQKLADDISNIEAENFK